MITLIFLTLCTGLALALDSAWREWLLPILQRIELQ